MRVIFLFKEILTIYRNNLQVYEKSYNTCTLATCRSTSVTYSTVTSACQGSGLACTRNVTILRTLTYMQTRFCHQNKPFYIGIGMK